MRPPFVSPLPLILGLAVAVALTADSAGAVVDLGAPSNRRLIALETVPSDAGRGTHDVVVKWTFDLDGGTALENFGTRAAITLSNGAPVDDLVWNIGEGRTHGCDGSSCGSIKIDGVRTDLVCSDTDARCHGPVLIGTFRGLSLSSDTEITVTLAASPGAVEEIDSTDDRQSIVFDSKNVSTVLNGTR